MCGWADEQEGGKEGKERVREEGYQLQKLCKKIFAVDKFPVSHFREEFRCPYLKEHTAYIKGRRLQFLSQKKATAQCESEQCRQWTHY